MKSSKKVWPDNHSKRAKLAVWVICAACGALGACGAPPGRAVGGPDQWAREGLGVAPADGLGGVEVRATVAADWDDLDAALDIGLERSEMATLTTTRGDDRRGWELTSLTDERGELVATRVPGAARDKRGCEMITIIATVNGPRSQERAIRLVRGMRARLEQLAGVGFAPVK